VIITEFRKLSCVVYAPDMSAITPMGSLMMQYSFFNFYTNWSYYYIKPM